jgi:hypothetical protein
MGLFAASVLLVACTSGGERNATGPDGGPAPALPAPTVVGKYDLSGAFNAKGDYAVNYGFAGTEKRDCGSVADSRRTYLTPVPTITDHGRFTWVAKVDDYRGPDDYGLDALKDLRVSVREAAEDEPVTYRAGEASTANLSVNKDNSGELEFTGLSGPSGSSLRGSLAWTCDDPE